MLTTLTDKPYRVMHPDRLFRGFSFCVATFAVSYVMSDRRVDIRHRRLVKLRCASLFLRSAGDPCEW